MIDEGSPVSVHMLVTATATGSRATLTTYGIVGGRYGSLGSVRVDTPDVAPPTSLGELARFILTALYGGPYDL